MLHRTQWPTRPDSLEMDPRRQVLGVGEVSIRQSSLPSNSPATPWSGKLGLLRESRFSCGLLWVDGTGRAIGEHATASTQGSYVFVTRRPKPLTTSLQVPIHKGSLVLHPSCSWETDATVVGRDHRCLAQSRRLRMAWNGQQKAGIDSLFTLVS